MKKKTLPVMLALALLVVALPVVAYAADARSMDVRFTLTENDLQPTAPPSDGSDGGPSTDPEPSGTYSIWIPSSISINHEPDFFISSTFFNISAAAQVVVSIDGVQTFPDGTFYLTCGDGMTAAQRMACNIQRGYAEDTSIPMETLAGPDDAVVAVFDSSGHRTSYGWVKLQPLYSLDNVAGEYTGTVHFKIELIRD